MSKMEKDFIQEIKKVLNNGIMDKMKIAMTEALEPFRKEMNEHTTRINSLEVKGGTCANHEKISEKINKANYNVWVIHAQWFVITVLAATVAWVIR